MKLIRTGFRDEAYRATGFAALFSRTSAGLDFELLKSVRKRKGNIAVVGRVLVMGTVQCERDSGVQSTGNRIARGCESIAAVAIRDRGRVRTAGQSDQIDNVPAIQWQIQDAGVLHNLTHSHTAGFDQRGIRLNLNLFADLPDFQNRIENGVAVDFQHNAGLDEGPETRQRRFNLIRADCKVRQDERSRLIGDGASRDAGFGLRRCNFDAGQDRFALVPNGTSNLCCCLRPDINRSTGQEKGYENHQD